MPSELSTQTPRRFLVLLEEQEARGNDYRPIIKRGPDPQSADARPGAQHAHHVALTYEPRHPSSLQQRGTFRVTDDEYLTIVEGRC